MALNKEERKKLDDTHDAAITLMTVLLGKNSDNGLVGDVRRNTKNINKLYAALVGISLVIGGGTGLAQWLG